MPRSTRNSSSYRMRTESSIPPLPSTRRQTRSQTHTHTHTRPVAAPPTRRPAKPKPLAFLSRPHHVIAADPNRQLALFRLPASLLQRIASDLPLVSLICLTLTCHHAVLALGTASWALSKREPWSMDRAEFVSLFTRQWPADLTFCARCDTLHPPTRPPSEHIATPLTRRCWGPGARVDYFPRSNDGTGYSLVFAHIAAALAESAADSLPGATGPPIDTLAGDYTITRNNIQWRVQSSARRLDGNLILQHIHTLRSTPAAGPALHAPAVLSLPLRLCPHQSTAAGGPPEKSVYMRHAAATKNSALLTHAICSAMARCVPAAGESVDPALFKRPAPSEGAQLARLAAGEDVLWRCRGCATKYRVECENETGRVQGKQRTSLVITSWHSFGRDVQQAAQHWVRIVRRTGPRLGTRVRNDEWWFSAARGVGGSDFVVCE